MLPADAIPQRLFNAAPSAPSSPPVVTSVRKAVFNDRASDHVCVPIVAIGVAAAASASLPKRRNLRVNVGPPRLHLHQRARQRWLVARQAASGVSCADCTTVPRAAQAGSAPGWREKYWFPVASVFELDPSRPTPVRIDGLDLVVWRVPSASAEHDDGLGVVSPDADDPSAGWRVFADRCPHRLAPLSEGRIEPKTGCLQCAYHGWEFNGGGACTRIPQVTPDADQRMRTNPRSAASAFPVRVSFGVIWAWLGEGAPQGRPQDVLLGTDLDNQIVFSSYTRDLPYGYDSLVENLIDPSHVPFAHHNLQGTRDDAKPINMEVAKQATAAEDGNLISFTFNDRTVGLDRIGDLYLRSPFAFFYTLDFVDGPVWFPLFEALQGGVKDGQRGLRAPSLNCVCVPVGPGRSRLILLQSHAVGKDQYLELLPQALGHVLINRFLDSDLAFLHYIDRNLRRGTGGPNEWQTAFYMPGESDRCVGAWRRWLAKEGAACVQADVELPASPLRRDDLFDRFQQHTSHCVSCRQALDMLEKGQIAFGGVGLASFIVDRLGTAADYAPAWVALQVAALVGVFGLQQVCKEFRQGGYEHYKS